jgi:hypothetical protein
MTGQLAALVKMRKRHEGDPDLVLRVIGKSTNGLSFFMWILHHPHHRFAL